MEIEDAGRSTNALDTDVPSIRFHSVHTENIAIAEDGAASLLPSCSNYGITFSARPVGVNEKVRLRIIEPRRDGCIAFGFTTSNPNTLAGGDGFLDKHKKIDVWVYNTLVKDTKNEVVCYSVNASGALIFGINDEYKELISLNINVTRKLWAFVWIWHCGTTVKFDRVENPRELLVEKRINLEVERSIAEPLPLHKTKGRTVNVLETCGIAARPFSTVCQGYLFSKHPMCLNQTVFIQILSTKLQCSGNFYIGVTSCDPTILGPFNLPDNPETLIDRAEFWKIFRTASNSLEIGDELAVRTSNGAIQISMNGSILATTPVQSERIWLFLVISGAIQAASILSAKECNCSPLRNLSDLPLDMSTRAQRLSELAMTGQNLVENRVESINLPNCYTNTTSSNEKNHVPNELVDLPIRRKEDTANECIICCEREIDTVLYDCGHMCLCYQCACRQMFDVGIDSCPICRAPILDLVRVYKP